MSTIKFVLVGPNQGKTLPLAGFVFRDGVAEVPTECETAHNILRNFNSAYPINEVGQDPKGNLYLKEKEEVTPIELKPIPPAPKPAPEPTVKPGKDK